MSLIEQHQTQAQGQQQQIQNKEFQTQQLFNRSIYLPYPQFTQSYQKSLKLLNNQTQEKVKRWAWNRQQQNYYYFIQPKKFVQYAAKQRLQHYQQRHSQLVIHFLLEAMKRRYEKVETDIISSSLIFVSNKSQNSIVKKNLQFDKSPELTLSQLRAQEQALAKKHKQIMTQQRKQKARLDKLKEKQQQIKKFNQQKILQQEKYQKQQFQKHHSEIISQKIVKSKEKRQKQKKLMQQRHQDYLYIVKSAATNQVLFQKMETEFKKRSHSLAESDRKKIQSQRQKLFLNAKIDELKINDHQQKYLKWKAENEAVRAAKIQEQQRTVEIYQKQLKKYQNYKNFNQKHNSDEQDEDEDNQNTQNYYHKSNSYLQVKEDQKKRAMQKRKKMQTYWSTFVKEEKRPKLDLKKKQQLQNLINSLQNAKKMRKVKNSNGEYVYEEIKLADSTLKGMQYLEYARELGRRRKSFKRKDSENDESSIHEENYRKKQSVDYLKKLRESRSFSVDKSLKMKNKLSFLQKNQMAFHEKLERVERETFKLEQLTKNSQNQLKYGKFNTSEQILQFKEDIDNNHVQILRIKLKLAANTKK